MPHLGAQGLFAAVAGVVDSARAIGGIVGDRSGYMRLQIKGRVNASGAFLTTVPFVNGMFRAAILRELAAMGSARLSLTGIYDADLPGIPLVEPGTMAGTPNVLFLGVANASTAEPFGASATAVVCCPVEIEIDGATADGRFSLELFFRRAP